MPGDLLLSGVATSVAAVCGGFVVIAKCRAQSRTQSVEQTSESKDPAGGGLPAEPSEGTPRSWAARHLTHHGV